MFMYVIVQGSATVLNPGVIGETEMMLISSCFADACNIAATAWYVL